MSDSVITLKNVSVVLNEQEIHQNISLSIFRGESVTLLGPSGTGKTVLLKLLLGLIPLAKGTASILGTDIHRCNEWDLVDVRRRVGMLFQGAALFDSLSVFENVAYGLRQFRQYGGRSESLIEQQVREKLQLVGLESKRGHFPAELSGGQKKRVGLARALALEPEIMLFDEPTTGLDPTSVRRIDDLIAELNNVLGITTVSVTHDISSARRISSRWILLSNGSIVADGAWHELEERSEEVHQFISGKWEDEFEDA